MCCRGTHCTQALRERRKKGMAYLQSMQESGAYADLEACAVCDAANGACEQR